jgi:spore maturation protein CgeB
LYLADQGIKVRVFGNAPWQRYAAYSSNLQIECGGLYNEDYAKSFRAFKISLCFLRKMNFDTQTTRTVEIPACGGFMLAERTEEHLAMFEEGKEAAFFSSDEELLEKCRYYLSHDDERLRIAEAGTLRCKTSDYSNEGMIRKVLQEICAG